MNVVFEEQAPIHTSPASGRGIVAWMIRNHVADTASHAQTMLLVAVVIVLALSALIGRSALSEEGVDTHKNFVPAVVR